MVIELLLAVTLVIECCSDGVDGGSSGSDACNSGYVRNISTTRESP